MEPTEVTLETIVSLLDTETQALFNEFKAVTSEETVHSMVEFNSIIVKRDVLLEVARPQLGEEQFAFFTKEIDKMQGEAFN